MNPDTYDKAARILFAEKLGWERVTSNGKTALQAPPEGTDPWRQAEMIAMGTCAITLSEEGMDADLRAVSDWLCDRSNPASKARDFQAMLDEYAYDDGRRLKYKGLREYADQIVRESGKRLRGGWEKVEQYAALVERGVWFEEDTQDHRPQPTLDDKLPPLKEGEVLVRSWANGRIVLDEDGEVQVTEDLLDELSADLVVEALETGEEITDEEADEIVLLMIGAMVGSVTTS